MAPWCCHRDRIVAIKFQRAIFNTHQTILPHMILSFRKKEEKHAVGLPVMLATTLVFKIQTENFELGPESEPEQFLCPLWEKQGRKPQIKCHFQTAGWVRKMNNLKGGYFAAFMSSAAYYGLGPLLQYPLPPDSPSPATICIKVISCWTFQYLKMTF